MKKILLIVFLFAAFGFNKMNAQQIYNNSFETWTNDTAYFDGLTLFPKDTFPYSDPAQWTTTNALSGADTFGHFFFVNQTATAHNLNSAIELTTGKLDSVYVSLLGGKRQLTIPGLALNGRFPLNLGANILTGGVISPMAVPGSGQPFTKRLATIKGFYDYAPVLKDTLHGYIDSCMSWAILRKGNKLIASAQFSSDSTTSGYKAFSANFVYADCDAPDTLVILLAASVPNFGSILTGVTGLVPGSILRVDDLVYDTLAANYNYPPIARADFDTTNKNTAKTINVLLNDSDCDGQALTISILTNAVNGTSTVVANKILYTPNNNYVGKDSVKYRATDASGNADSWAKILVVNTTGISQANQIPVVIYPVPATNELNIQFENTGKATVRVFDMVGNLVHTSLMTGNTHAINLETLANGIYAIQITDEHNAVIARTKFTVSK